MKWEKTEMYTPLFLRKLNSLQRAASVKNNRLCSIGSEFF